MKIFHCDHCQQLVFFENIRCVKCEHDAKDRRVWRVHLTDEVEPALRTMRAIAKELRRDALTGITAVERERFVDTLLAIKENLR